MNLSVPPLRLVLDTNVLLAGLVSNASPSQAVVDSLQVRRAVPLISPAVVAEYCKVLFHPAILARFEHLSLRKIELALYRLQYVADKYPTIREKFRFDRDPRDAKFIELAITGAATHLITLDPDLISLASTHNDAARRFRQRLPRIEVLRPAEFVGRYADLLGND